MSFIRTDQRSLNQAFTYTTNTTDAFNTTNSTSNVSSDTGNTSITVGSEGVQIEKLLPWVIAIAALWGAMKLLSSKG